MAYFTQGAETRLTTDASPVGVGAILEQKQKDGSYRPIYYARIFSVYSRFGLVEWFPVIKFLLKVPPVIVVCAPNSYYYDVCQIRDFQSMNLLSRRLLKISFRVGNQLI